MYEMVTEDSGIPLKKKIKRERSEPLELSTSTKQVCSYVTHLDHSTNVMYIHSYSSTVGGKILTIHIRI